MDVTIWGQMKVPQHTMIFCFRLSLDILFSYVNGTIAESLLIVNFTESFLFTFSFNELAAENEPIISSCTCFAATLIFRALISCGEFPTFKLESVSFAYSYQGTSGVNQSPQQKVPAAGQIPA